MNRYERLLRLYPKDYRDRYGAELLDTLNETDRSRIAESLNLIRGAAVARARRLRSGQWHDAFAITSLLAPILMLAGAADGMHEIGWFVYNASPLPEALAAFPDGPVWLSWLLVLGLFRLRRTSMVLSWFAAAATVIVLNERVIQSPTGVAGWSLLAILTATACTASNVRRGYELVGRNRTLLVVAGVFLVLLIRVLGHHPALYLATLVIALACAIYAAFRTSLGWQVTALLATPALATASTLWLYLGAPFRVQRTLLPHAVYEYGFALIVLTLVVVTWRVAARRVGEQPSA